MISRRICFWDPDHTLKSELGRWDKAGWFYITIEDRQDMERILLTSLPSNPNVTRMYVRSIQDADEMWQEVLGRLNRYATSLGLDRAEVDYAE